MEMHLNTISELAVLYSATVVICAAWGYGVYFYLCQIYKKEDDE